VDGNSEGEGNGTRGARHISKEISCKELCKVLRNQAARPEVREGALNPYGAKQSSLRIL
jgi:hypothetical protein